MRRFHLFEIHDFAWCPRVIRDGLTDFLAVAIATNNSYGPVLPRLRAAIQKAGSTRILDLCSGAGGPWQTWLAKFHDLPPVTLTDKFPNQRIAAAANVPGMNYCPDSVDATAVPAELTGFRTIFTATHHFRPEMVESIINDAVAGRQPIGIFECTHRSPRGLFFMMLSAIAVLLLTPKMKNPGWAKLFLTYVLPVIPLVTTFDGIVSALRTYTVSELSAWATDPSYDWQIGTEPNLSPVTYLIGVPKADN